MLVTIAAAGLQPSAKLEYQTLRALISPLFVPHLFQQTCRTLTMTVLPLHALMLGLTYDQVALLIAVQAAGVVLGNIPAAYLTTIMGSRATLQVTNLMVSVVGLTSAICLAGAETPDYLAISTFVLAFFFNGMIEGISNLGRSAMIGSSVRASIRGRVSSAVGGVNRFGYMLGVAIGGSYATWAGADRVYQLQGMFALVTMLVTAIFSPYIDPAEEIKSEGRMEAPTKVANSSSDVSTATSGGLVSTASRHSMKSVLLEHSGPLAIASTVGSAVFFMRKAREILFALEGHSRGMSQGEVGRITALSFLIDGMLFPIGGYLLDKVGRGRVAAASFFIMGVALVLLVLPDSHLAIFAVLSGLSNGISSGLITSIGFDFSPPDCYGHFGALYRMISRGAELGSSAVIGIVAAYVSVPAADAACAMVCPIGFFLALTFIPDARRPMKPIGWSDLCESDSEDRASPAQVA